MTSRTSGSASTSSSMKDHGTRSATCRWWGTRSLTAPHLIEFLDLKQGDYFNLETMQRDENTLRDLYGGKGHIFADIKASPRFLEQPGELDLVYQIDEGELFRVGKINIHVAGESPNTRRDVILNRLSLRPGDIVDIREVRASERRLKASQLFITNPQKVRRLGS